MVAAPPSPQRGAGKSEAQARSRQWEARSPCSGDITAIGRAQAGPMLTPNRPFPRTAPGVAVCLADVQGQIRPLTWPRRPIGIDSTSAGGGRHLGPDRSGSLGSRLTPASWCLGTSASC